jgi:hypothetical protein
VSETIVIVVVSLMAVGVLVSLLGRAGSRSRRSAPQPGPVTEGATDSGDVIVPTPTFRVVALGGSGAGKTVFLSTVFQHLKYPTAQRSYYLDTTPEQAVTLANIYASITDTTRPWPSGTRTADTREFVFDCVGTDEQGRRRRVLTLSFLDYAGGLLEWYDGSESEAFHELQERIRGASALLLMIDGNRIRQLFANDPAATAYFHSTISPMLGFAQGATCPIHVLLTKWDLVCDVPALRGLTEDDRLRRVVDALMEIEHIRALVYLRSPGQLVRLIPVSSVGPSFAAIDDRGHVVKRPHGRVAPTNIDVPLSVIVPDYFRQVRASLDAQTAAAIQDAVRNRLRLEPHEMVGAAASTLARPAGAVIRMALKTSLGVEYGDEVYQTFLDWLAGPFHQKGTAIGGFRARVEQERALVEQARANVLDEFTRTVYRFDAQYPASLLRQP